MSPPRPILAREQIAALVVVAILGSILFGWTGALRRAHPPEPTLDDPSALLPMDPHVIVDSLENGLRYYVKRNGFPERTAELRLVVNAGSILEDDDQRGLAHAVEHMAFRGTEHFPDDQLVGYLQSLGMRSGEDLNAYTGFDETVYRLTVPLDRSRALERAFTILADWAHGIRFDPLDAARERGVVFAEWREGRSAGRRLFEARTAALLDGSRYAARLPIGDTATLSKFDLAAMRRFYTDWYRPDLISVVAVGDFSPARVRQLVREHFGGIPRPASPRPRPVVPVAFPDHPRAVVLSDDVAPRARVALWRLEAARAPRVVRDMRARIARELFDSLLDARLADAALRDDSPLRVATSSRSELTRGVDAHVVYADVPERAILPGLEALATELERVRRHGFTSEEFERQRRAMVREAEQELYFDETLNSATIAEEYVRHYLRGEPILSRSAGDSLHALILPAIRLEEVNAFAAAVGSDSGRVAVITTNRRGSRVASGGSVLTTLAAVRARAVEPYEAPVPLGPLIARRPEPGHVTSEKELPELQMVDWTLSNGMRVLLKPTPFRAHEILFLAWSAGGASMAEDADYLSAFLSDRVVDASGVGAFDAAQLERMFDASSVSVSPEMGDAYVAIRGSSNFEDVVTLFQLAHLYFTAPRVDTAAFRGMREQLAQRARGRATDPEAAFRDTVAATLSQHHPRNLTPTADAYRAMSLARALGFYRARMANASNFTVVIVGSFESGDLRDLVETYLGSLPPGTRELPRDVGVRYARGVVERTLRRGTEPRADTRISFTGSIEPTSRTLTELHVLRDLLAVALESRVRDSLGGTYGVNVELEIRNEPRHEYALSVSFAAAPQRIDSLADAILAEVDRLRTHGPTRQELANEKAAEARELAAGLEDNSWWLDRIESHLALGWPLEEIGEERRIIDRMTVESVRDAASRFVSAKNYVRVTRYPEADAPQRATRHTAP